MKKPKHLNTKRAEKKPRIHFRAGVFATLALLTAGVVTAIAKHESRPGDARSRENTRAVTNETAKDYPNVEMTRTKLQSVAETLQQRPLTQEEAQRLAEEIKKLANQSTEGLESVRHADGSVSIDLKDRFQNVTLAKKNADGTVEQACVDNPRAGAVFFEIDPRLVGSTNSGKPVSRPPVKQTAKE